MVSVQHEEEAEGKEAEQRYVSLVLLFLVGMERMILILLMPNPSQTIRLRTLGTDKGRV